MAEIFNFDPVAANNNSAPPNGWPEFMEYEEVNDTGRELMATLSRFYRTALSGLKTTAGTQPAYTLVSGQTFVAYSQGQLFAFVAHATSTGTVTLNVDGKGAAAITDSRGNPLIADDIISGGIYYVLRTASAFKVVGHLSGLSVASAVGVDTFRRAFVTAGSSNAFTVTTGGLFTAYANDQIICVRPDRANTGAATINIDGLGAEAWQDFAGNALVSGDIGTGEVCILCRVGGAWRTVAGIPVDLSAEVSGVLPVANGGTGGATALAAVENLITPLTQTVIAPGDLIPFSDISDGNDGKKGLASTIGAGKHSMWIPASAMHSAGSPSSGVLNISGALFPYLAFDPSASEFAFFNIGMPKSWNEGTLTARVYWTHPATTTNFGTAWAVQLASFGDDDALANAYAGATITDTGGTTSDLYISAESSALDPGNTEVQGDWLACLVSRLPADGADNLAVDAYLIGVMLFYTTDANTDD